MRIALSEQCWHGHLECGSLALAGVHRRTSRELAPVRLAHRGCHRRGDLDHNGLGRTLRDRTGVQRAVAVAVSQRRDAVLLIKRHRPIGGGKQISGKQIKSVCAQFPDIANGLAELRHSARSAERAGIFGRQGHTRRSGRTSETDSETVVGVAGVFQAIQTGRIFNAHAITPSAASPVVYGLVAELDVAVFKQDDLKGQAAARVIIAHLIPLDHPPAIGCGAAIGVINAAG